jgi:hypothetical protein
VFQSDYIDLAISIAVVFFLTSLVVSGLHEALAWGTRIRSKFLWSYLHDLCDPSRVKTLPRGLVGVLTFGTTKQDRRPRTVPLGTFTPPLLQGGTATGSDPTIDVTNLLQHLARALDPVDVPERTVRNMAATPEEVTAAEQVSADAATGQPSTAAVTPAVTSRTSIQHVPSGSLAQAFIEVFAEVGKERLIDALTSFGNALQGAQPTDTDAAAVVTTLVGSDPAAASGMAAALATLVAAARATTDEDAAAQAKAFVDEVEAVAGAHSSPDLAGAATAFVNAVRSGGDVATAASGLWRPLAWAFPDHFPRERIEAAVRSLQDCPLGPTSRRLWEASGRKLDEFRSSLEGYFDQEMTRVSGYYKRSIRWILFLLAIIVAVVSNIDALTLTRDLWRNPGGRSTLVMQADSLTTDGAAPAGSDGSGSTSKTLAALRAECEDRFPTGETSSTKEIAQGFADARACVTDALSAESGLDVIDRAAWIAPKRWADDWTDTSHYHWVVHPLGVALTVVALVLGAPFWFDLLKRLTGIRRGLVGQT